MADWEEILRLQAELESVQEECVKSRLSERNCVELVMKLKELKLITLIHSTNGKFYLTPDRVNKEVLTSLGEFGGRASVADISTDLGIDFTIVEKAADHISAEHDLIKLQGQLISSVYIRHLAAQINSLLKSRGIITIAEICRSHDLPSDFVIEKLLPSLDGKINSEKSDISTNSFLRRLEVRLRGFLVAALHPVKVADFYRQNKIDETLFNSIFNKLIEAAQIKGKLVGRGNSATFIPTIYIQRQTIEIKEKIESQGHIGLTTLKQQMQLNKDSDAITFMKETD